MKPLLWSCDIALIWKNAFRAREENKTTTSTFHLFLFGDTSPMSAPPHRARCFIKRVCVCAFLSDTSKPPDTSRLFTGLQTLQELLPVCLVPPVHQEGGHEQAATDQESQPSHYRLRPDRWAERHAPVERNKQRSYQANIIYTTWFVTNLYHTQYHINRISAFLSTTYEILLIFEFARSVTSVSSRFVTGQPDQRSELVFFMG